MITSNSNMLSHLSGLHLPEDEGISDMCHMHSDVLKVALPLISPVRTISAASTPFSPDIDACLDVLDDPWLGGGSRILDWIYGIRKDEMPTWEQELFLRTSHRALDISKFQDLIPIMGIDWVDEAHFSCLQEMLFSGNHIDHYPSLFTVTSEGASGSYFIHSRDGDVVAVFKPANEELGSLHHHVSGDPLGQPRRLGATANGVVPGTGCYFEVIAYRLAKEVFKGEVVVPYTIIDQLATNAFSLTGCEKEPDPSELLKVGALQQYCKGVCGSKLSVDEIESRVSKRSYAFMMAFDLMTYCVDRNASNVIITDDNQLVLIDHAALFAKNLLANMNLFWKESQAAQAPFPDEVAKLIDSIRIDSIISIIEDTFVSHGKSLDDDYIKSASCCLTILKTGVKLQMTPFEILALYESEIVDGFGGESAASRLIENSAEEIDTILQQAHALQEILRGKLLSKGIKRHEIDAILLGKYWNKPFIAALLSKGYEFEELTPYYTALCEILEREGVTSIN